MLADDEHTCESPWSLEELEGSPTAAGQKPRKGCADPTAPPSLGTINTLLINGGRGNAATRAHSPNRRIAARRASLAPQSASVQRAEKKHGNALGNTPPHC